MSSVPDKAWIGVRVTVSEMRRFLEGDCLNLMRLTFGNHIEDDYMVDRRAAHLLYPNLTDRQKLGIVDLFHKVRNGDNIYANIRLKPKKVKK